jgi:hypothetical protein
MSKSNIFTALTFTLLSLVSFSNSQAQTLTDPGMSVHNYKMPNKAVLAKKQNPEQHFVSTMNPVSGVELQQTAKYAVTPASIVFAIDPKKQTMNINPLSSVANYKTQSAPKMQSVTDEYSALVD